jgi:hypothetical protein
MRRNTKMAAPRQDFKFDNKISLRRHYDQFLNSKLCHLVIMAGNFQDVFVSDIYDRNFGGFDPVYLENVVLISRRKSLFFQMTMHFELIFVLCM